MGLNATKTGSCSNPLAADRLQTTFQRCEDSVIVNFGGELDFYSVESFRRKFALVQKAGVCKFIFDLGGLDYIDSTGLAFLVGVHRQLKVDGGLLVCLAPHASATQKILETSKLKSVLVFAAGREEAIKQFQLTCASSQS